MPKTIITLPCTAQDLESALHAVCDHHGLWNGRIDTMCDGSDSGDACVSIVLSEGSGETSPSPSTPAPETHAAILAELRSIANAMEMSLHPKDGWPTMSGKPIFVYFADLANRLESAWKREKAEIEAAALEAGGVVEAARQKPVGNSAAMREALAELVEYLEKESRLYDTIGNIAAFLLKKFKLRAALNKPLRNCDLYGGDYKMLHTAWFDWTGSPSGHNPDGYESWCPKAQFEAAGRPVDGMTFGIAIDACRYKGAKIQRSNWNGVGQYVEFRECATLNQQGVEDHSSCFVFHFVNRKTGETGIQVGWLASQADMAACDWRIVE